MCPCFALRLASSNALPVMQISIPSPLCRDPSPAAHAVQQAYHHIGAARWEVDVFRPTHYIPARPFATVAMLCRAGLSSAALLLYPVESGTLRLRLCAVHAAELRAVGHAFDQCCG